MTQHVKLEHKLCFVAQRLKNIESWFASKPLCEVGQDKVENQPTFQEY
jgi:hypothetical protein